MSQPQTRMTRQRMVILEELRKVKTHPTADELYAMVRTRMPRISLGTVYRNLDFLTESKEILKLESDGSIRRFGASIKHQKTGWTHNAMVAWIVDEAASDAIGEVAAKNQRISHVYFRPTSAPDWPYTLYTMVHGRSEDECLQVIEELRRETALDEYAVLDSLEELKKTSMTYF